MADESNGAGALSLRDLADELERWANLAASERDEYGAFADLKHVYKFAIANYEQPGIDLLLRALDSGREDL